MPSTFRVRWWHPHFIALMDRLGIRTYKRWWPTNGSFWNHKHIDPSNNDDLAHIIKLSWSYIQLHGAGFASEVSVLMIIVLCYSYYHAMISLGVVVMYHLMSCVINGYNIIRAHLKIIDNQALEQSNPTEKDTLLTIYSREKRGHQVMFGYAPLSPYLRTKAQAEHYRAYLLNKHGSDRFTYEELIFVDRVGQIYLEYKSTLS